MIGDELRDYECPEEWLNSCNENCSYRGECVVLPVFRTHIELRRAVLGDMTPAKATEMYRKVARLFAKYTPSKEGAKAHFNAIADMIEKL